MRSHGGHSTMHAASSVRSRRDSASGSDELLTRQRKEGSVMKSSHAVLAYLASGAMSGVMMLVSLDAVAEAPAAKTVVLVHGAFADGSSWHKVIPLLKKEGLKVIAVQNPLESLEGDVAFTNRALELAEGPVVLVA